ncbi:MAG: hypothetical protein ACOX7P_01195 [Oscillospiraceae bacterium]
MNKRDMMKWAAIAVLVGTGAGVFAAAAPKKKSIRYSGVKAARALAGFIDSIGSAMGF